MSQRPRGEKREKLKSEKSNQNIAMSKENVKYSVMNAKIDPKVVMELSIFNLGGWNNLQPSNHNLLEKLRLRMNRGC